MVAAVSPSRSRPKSSPAAALTDEFVARAGRYMPCDTVSFPTEQALLEWADRQAGRTAPKLILLDTGGKQLASEEFAELVRKLRDSAVQLLILAIGPADGWSDRARARADLLMSLGPMTLPHELARAVVAEQVYRALTIIAGHPYHSGH